MTKKIVEQPTSGGSYTRGKNGKLTLVSATLEAGATAPGKLEKADPLPVEKKEAE